MGRIVVDSFDELDRLESLAADGLARAGVLVRVTPGVEAHTHEFIETGTEDSKFGFGLQNGDALRGRRARRRATARCASPACTATSARRCSGSTRSRPRSIAWSALVRAVETQTGATVDELNMGGGLGVRYVATDEAPTIAQYAAALHEVVAKALADARRAVAADADGRARAARSRRRRG